MERESARIMEELAALPDRVAAVFLSRPYTLYDDFVSKGSLRYARQIGMTALPHEFLYYYLQGWLAAGSSRPISRAGARSSRPTWINPSTAWTTSTPSSCSASSPRCSWPGS